MASYKRKLANFLNNQSKTIEVLDLTKILNCLSEQHKDITWTTLELNQSIEVLFYTFKPLVKEGSIIFKVFNILLGNEYNDVVFYGQHL